MSLNDAYKKALEDLAQVDPLIAASRSGAGLEGGCFTMPVFGRKYAVRLPGGESSGIERDVSPPQFLEVLLMHYLAKADGTPVSDIWISYRQLPGGQLFERRFSNLVYSPLAAMFGNDIEGFRESALAIGGRPLELTGDAAFRFDALPRVPMACILSSGEAEIPSAVTVLFDKTAPGYLSTDDLTILGGFMVSLFRKTRNNSI